jgi:AraC-like DNA-binding protein
MTDRTGIVDPRMLEEASIINHDEVRIYPMHKDRTLRPFRWTAVRYKSVDDYIENHILERMGEDELDDYQLNQMAQALKYDFTTFKRKYKRAFRREMYDIEEDDQSEAESATSIDKNTIG